MLATLSFMTPFFSSVIPLGGIPHIVIAFFKISSSSSHIPWTSTALTSTVSINFEQSHLFVPNFDTEEELYDNQAKSSS